MMRSMAVFSVVLAALAVPVAFAAEQVREIDASGGTSKGQWVIILSKAAAANAPIGTAAVVLGNGDTFEAAYGMSVVAGKPVVATIAEDVIASERASEKEPAASTLIVKVSEAQHGEIKKILDTWAKKPEHIDPPNDVAVNFAQEIVDALGMKRAYRTGLGPVNPILYYADLSTINRKLGQPKSDS